MKTYAHVVDGIVVEPPIALDDAFVPGKDIFTVKFAENLHLCEATVQAGWIYDGSAFAAPAAPAAIPLSSVKTAMSADIDAQAEARRLRHVTGGACQAMVYLVKMTEAAQALADANPSAVAYPLLAAEVGVTDDPTSGQPAADITGVARAVAAKVTTWREDVAAIEGIRLRAKAAIAAAATACEAQASHDAVVWPA